MISDDETGGTVRINVPRKAVELCIKALKSCSFDAKFVTSHKEHPDLLVVWNPEADLGIKESVEIWDPVRECENCSKVGCYVLRDDRNSAGACREHLEEEARTTQKTMILVTELPDIHAY